MTTTQILIAIIGLLGAFILNHLLGKLLWHVWGESRRTHDQYISRQEHSMCSAHTSKEFAQVRGELAQMRIDNAEAHGKLFDRFDALAGDLREIKTSVNGSRS